MDAEVATRIEQFCDTLADFDRASPDAALKRLLDFLCNELNAQNASWMAAVRMDDIGPGDPLWGWRPRALGFLHPTARLKRRAKSAVRQIESGDVDITQIRNVAQAGHWRRNRLIDLTGPDWFAPDFYQRYYLEHGQRDALWLGCPLNVDTELHFGIYRGLDQPMFSEADRRLGAALVRPLKWFYRELLLSHGLGISQDPLTHAQRLVLHGLLAGHSEQVIATQLSQSPHTTHTHIKALYRKFGISTRAELQALWLGTRSPDAHKTPPKRYKRNRRGRP